MCVRNPAACSRISRSMPIAIPATAATASRTTISIWMWVNSGDARGALCVLVGELTREVVLAGALLVLGE